MNYLHQHYDIPQKVNHVQSIKSIIVNYNAIYNEIPRNAFDKSRWKVHVKA